jgi:hypothetical protein
VLTFLLGPILALLPRRWRKSAPFGSSIDWKRATAFSGLGESVLALIGLVYWYSYAMNYMVSHGLDAALAGKMTRTVTDQEIGFAALVVWASHPLTLLLAAAGVEGTVRMVAAAITETNLGIFPLYLIAKIHAKIIGQSEPSAAKAAGFTQGNMASIAGTIREKALYRSLQEIPDELFFSNNGADEFLEIRASQKKEEWIPPRTVRMQDTFYRLEGSSNGLPPRPFHYTLRKLSAGVMGRTVLDYAPRHEPVQAKK